MVGNVLDFFLNGHSLSNLVHSLALHAVVSGQLGMCSPQTVLASLSMMPAWHVGSTKSWGYRGLQSLDEHAHIHQGPEAQSHNNI